MPQNGNGEVRALIFDCDGTLADTMPPHYMAWAEILKRYGMELSEDRFYSLGGWPTLKVAELLVEESGQSLDAHRMAEEKESRFRELIPEVRAIQPVTHVASQNRGKLPMAVATGGVRTICEQILRQIEVSDWFDAVVCCEDVKRHKPNPDIFLEAARRLKVNPRHCQVYEDADPGIEAARQAGMQYVDIRKLFTPRRIT